MVTVLFCDLVGFTARSDHADPEDVRAILQPFHTLARSEIERHGGTLDKFIGDAAMGVFGSPVAHEDDPERAARAALRILAGVKDLNEQQPGDPFDVRVGLNTGEAIVTLAQGVQEGENVAGDVVNTAARLQATAAPGAVLVGETTYRATRNVIDYEPLDPVALKGKAEPVPIWRVLGARSRSGAEDHRPTTPLVGREDDLRTFEQTYQRTLRESSVQLLSLVGEAGLGKSRLVLEFFRYLDEQPELVSWRQGRCLPYGEGITFWALEDIVKAQAGILESDPPEAVAAKLLSAVGAVVEEPSDRSWIHSRLAPLVGLEAQGATERAESFTAWQRFLEGVAAKGPLVMVVRNSQELWNGIS